MNRSILNSLFTLKNFANLANIMNNSPIIHQFSELYICKTFINRNNSVHYRYVRLENITNLQHHNYCNSHIVSWLLFLFVANFVTWSFPEIQNGLFESLITSLILDSEAATRGVPCKKMFLEISQNSQENTCARVSFLIKLQG